MNHRYLIAAVVAAGAFWACSGEQPDSVATSSSNSSSDTSSTTAAGPAGNTGAVSVASSSSGMGFECDPPAEAGSLYELFEKPLYVPQELSMCQYRNDVMLIVNTAAI